MRLPTDSSSDNLLNEVLFYQHTSPYLHTEAWNNLSSDFLKYSSNSYKLIIYGEQNVEELYELC